MSESTTLSDHAGAGTIHAGGDHEVHYGVPGYDPTGAKMGMWVFLFTEVLLFGGLFICYAVYLYAYTFHFSTASAELSIPVGGFNTLVLLTSSLSMALAIATLQRGKVALCQKLLNFTIACAVVFCVIKAFEWGGKFEHGIWPGSEKVAALPYGQQVYWSLYFAMTGLHALHVIVGAAFIIWVKGLIRKGKVTAERDVTLENVGLYWHLVDLVWIFLFPLFYLIA